MEQITDRMIRAAKLDPSLYREVASDEGALSQALVVVLISAAAAGLGLIFGGLPALLMGAIVAIASWGIWACLVYFIGTQLMPEPGVKPTISQVLRATGFAAAPGVVRIVSFIPLLGWFINMAASLWMFAAFVVAIKEVLHYESTGKAVVVCIVGFVVQMIVVWLLILMPLGGAALLFGF